MNICKHIHKYLLKWKEEKKTRKIETLIIGHQLIFYFHKTMYFDIILTLYI